MVDLMTTEIDEQFFSAVERGDFNTVKELIENGANVDARDRMMNTPLIRAASLGNAKMVELFLEHGADINAQNADGQTALIAAADYNRHLGNLDVDSYEATIKLLLDAGADVQVRDNTGRTAYDYARPSIKKLIESHMKSQMITEPAMSAPEMLS